MYVGLLLSLILFCADGPDCRADMSGKLIFNRASWEILSRNTTLRRALDLETLRVHVPKKPIQDYFKAKVYAIWVHGTVGQIVWVPELLTNTMP